MTTPTEVDYHFDLMCPWAYQTSRWMRDVRDQLGLTVNWRFFSLEEVNLRQPCHKRARSSQTSRQIRANTKKTTMPKAQYNRKPMRFLSPLPA